MLMFKIVRRLIGFVVFAGTFVCVTATVFLVGFGWVNPYEYFPGLPAPPQIDTHLPGESPFGEFGEAQQTLDSLRPGESIPLRGIVQQRSLMREVPVPQQVSTSPEVVGSNFLIAIIMMLIFGITTTMLGNMVRDEEPRIKAWLKTLGITDLVGWITGLFSWTLSRGVKRGCLTLPLIFVIFILYGVIFAFLEEGTNLISRSGAYLAVTMAFSVGLVSLGGDLARRIAARIWGEHSSFQLYPIGLGVAVVSVVISRVLNISPGIVFGTPGGAEIDAPRDERKAARREMTLSLITLAVLIVLGGGAWALTAGIVESLDLPVEYRVARVLGFVLSAATNTALALFLVALETSFFEMMPFAYSTGQPIFKTSKILWAILFFPIAFLFTHTLMNPASGFLASFQEANVRLMWFMLLILIGVTGGMWFYFNVIDDVLREFFGVRLPGDPPRRRPQPQQQYYEQRPPDDPHRGY